MTRHRRWCMAETYVQLGSPFFPGILVDAGLVVTGFIFDAGRTE